MHLTPENQQQLADWLRSADARKECVEQVDLSRLNRVLEYAPEDMTATVEAGITLGEFQSIVRRNSQWLPVDPPFDQISIAELLDRNLSGPRRLGYGTIRDYLIGIKVVLANGELVKAGGKVVKNVAGYDLCKLFVGSRQTLGVIVEAVFKLRPLPEKELILHRPDVTLEALPALFKSIQAARINPVVFDLYRGSGDTAMTCVLGLAGAIEDVDAKLELAGQAGFMQPGILDYDKAFWTAFPSSSKVSVAPSKVLDLLEQVEGPFVCRVGNGVLYHNSSLQRQKATTPPVLMDRVKSIFDPNRIFPEFEL